MGVRGHPRVCFAAKVVAAMPDCRHKIALGNSLQTQGQRQQLGAQLPAARWSRHSNMEAKVGEAFARSSGSGAVQAQSAENAAQHSRAPEHGNGYGASAAAPSVGSNDRGSAQHTKHSCAPERSEGNSAVTAAARRQQAAAACAP